MEYLNGASDSNMLSHQIFALYYAHFKTLLFLQEKKIGTAGLSLTQSLLPFFSGGDYISSFKTLAQKGCWFYADEGKHKSKMGTVCLKKKENSAKGANFMLKEKNILSSDDTISS